MTRDSIGSWCDPEVGQRARAAYMYDLRHHPEAPAGFIQWLHCVIELHIHRSVRGRRMQGNASIWPCCAVQSHRSAGAVDHHAAAPGSVNSTKVDANSFIAVKASRR